MPKHSIGKEMLEVAMQLERNGHDCYLAMAERAQLEEVRYTLNWLADSEMEHMRAFRNMLARLDSYAPPEGPVAHQMRIQEVAESSALFAEKNVESELNKRISTDLEAIEIAIEHKENFLSLYKEIEGMVEGEDRTVLEMILEEERKHLSELRYHAAKLKSV